MGSCLHHPSFLLLPRSSIPPNGSEARLRRQQLYGRVEGHKRSEAERGSQGSWWVIALQTYTPGPGNWELLTGGYYGAFFQQAWTCTAGCMSFIIADKRWPPHNPHDHLLIGNIVSVWQTHKKNKTHKCTKVKNLQQHLMLDATTAVFSAWQCPPLHRKKPRYVKESEKGKKKRHIRMCQLGIKCLEGSCEPISTW